MKKKMVKKTANRLIFIDLIKTYKVTNKSSETVKIGSTIDIIFHAKRVSDNGHNK